jgi:hypothetical protein
VTEPARNDEPGFGSDVALENLPVVERQTGTCRGRVELVDGTTTAAYAIVGADIVRLDPGNVRTPVRDAGGETEDYI